MHRPTICVGRAGVPPPVGAGHNATPPSERTRNETSSRKALRAGRVLDSAAAPPCCDTGPPSLSRSPCRRARRTAGCVVQVDARERTWCCDLVPARPSSRSAAVTGLATITPPRCPSVCLQDVVVARPSTAARCRRAPGFERVGQLGIRGGEGRGRLPGEAAVAEQEPERVGIERHLARAAARRGRPKQRELVPMLMGRLRRLPDHLLRLAEPDRACRAVGRTP